MRKHLCLLPLASALLLTGCISMAPDFERPEDVVAPAWPADEAVRNAVVLTEGLQQWSDFFTDPRLVTLIRTGLENNRSLRSAMMAVEQARALYGVERANYFPSISAVAQENAQRTPRSVNASGRDITSHTYTASLAMASYELDLWGRVRNLTEQALQAYMQSEAAQRTTQMTVIAEIANTWLTLGASKQLLNLAASTYESQKESLALIEKSYELGASSLLDVQQARTTVATAEAAMAQAKRQLSQARNALTLLVGGPVDAALEPEGMVQNVTSRLSAASNVPSEVLLARPDIASAEAALRSANANIGVARATFFPRIALTGALGTTSPELSNLFEGGTRMWNFVPSVTLPPLHTKLTRCSGVYSTPRSSPSLPANRRTVASRGEPASLERMAKQSQGSQRQTLE